MWVQSANVSWILDKQKTNASPLPQALQAPFRSPRTRLGHRKPVTDFLEGNGFPV